MKAVGRFVISLAICATATCARAAAQEQENPFARIGHVVVIFTENRSFDHVFGLFPGAEGVNSAQHPPQVDFDGRPLAALPRPRADDRFPRRLPNAPFRLEPFVDIDGHTMDPVHDFYLEQEQIDGGKMDRFVEASNAGALVMGYYDGSELKQWALAKEFTLADHFFPRGVRRLDAQPFLPDLRLRAGLRQSGGGDQKESFCQSSRRSRIRRARSSRFASARRIHRQACSTVRRGISGLAV